MSLSWLPPVSPTLTPSETELLTAPSFLTTV